MKIKKFRIVSPRDVQSTDNVFETLLLNMDHIISLKPIKIVIDDKVAKGYWIRTTNGKKYRATEIPQEIKDLLDENDGLSSLLSASNSDQIESQLIN